MEKIRVVIQRSSKGHCPWVVFLSNTRKDYHLSGQNGFYEKAWPGSGDRHLEMAVEQLLVEGCELVSDTIIEVANLPDHFPLGFPLAYEQGIQNEFPLTGGEYELTTEAGEELYQKAVKLVLETRNARNTFLRFKLGIGQSTAAALIERMTEEGILGPCKGSNSPREILKS